MRSPEGRRVVFVGDLVDRGPGVVETLRLAMRMVAAGVGFCAPGNHDVKLLRALMGRHVWVAHGLRDSLDQIDRLPGEEAAALSAAFQAFTLGLPPYLMLDGGALVVAHAGLPERFHGRVSGRVRSLVLYGESIGDDDDGLPIRVDWAADYRGAATVVYGHTPQREARLAQQHDQLRYRLRLRREADGGALAGARGGQCLRAQGVCSPREAAVRTSPIAQEASGGVEWPSAHGLGSSPTLYTVSLFVYSSCYQASACAEAHIRRTFWPRPRCR